MLVTTNNLTQEFEILERTIPASGKQAEIARQNHEDAESRIDKLTELREIRIAVEERGFWQEYEALASEYEAIGAVANAETLRRKAAALRGAR